MLVAHRTVPHYHPVTQMTAEELETWFTSPEDGLGVPPNAVEALKEEVNNPSDLLGLNLTTPLSMSNTPNAISGHAPSKSTVKQGLFFKLTHS